MRTNSDDLTCVIDGEHTACAAVDPENDAQMIRWERHAETPVFAYMSVTDYESAGEGCPSVCKVERLDGSTVILRCREGVVHHVAHFAEDARNPGVMVGWTLNGGTDLYTISAQQYDHEREVDQETSAFAIALSEAENALERATASFHTLGRHGCADWVDFPLVQAALHQSRIGIIAAMIEVTP